MSFRDVILKRLEKDTELPTLPGVFSKVSNLLRSDDASAADIAKVMKDDPVMTTKILRVVNSAVFGGHDKISSVSLAVARLGFKLTADIVMSLSVINLFQENGGLSYKRFWRHSLSVAFASDFLITYMHVDRELKDTLFTAGILHDIGMLVVDQYAPEIYSKVIKYAQEKDIVIEEVEEQLLGMTHAEVGAVMLKKWNMAENIIDAVKNHHHPLSATSKSVSLAEVVHLANFICNNQGIDNGVGVSPPGFSEAAWFDCGLDVDIIPEIIDKVQFEVQKSEVMLAVSG